MPYLVVDNFSAGLDSRRSSLSSRDGTLTVCKNAHITRGGEIEKRKAFAQFASLPAGTFGMETTSDKVYVFGSAATLPMPSGVTYQRLQHPDSLDMTKVVWSTVYGGLPFVIAEYTDGKRYCFWDGSIIGDWFSGVVRASTQSISSFVESIRADFSLAGYTCTRSGNVLTITGPAARKFTVTADFDHPLTATVENIQETVDGDAELLGSASFNIWLNSSGYGVSECAVRAHALQYLPQINGLYVNNVGTNLLNAPAHYSQAVGSSSSAESPETWFNAISLQINAKSGSAFKAVHSIMVPPGETVRPSHLVIRRFADGKLAEHYIDNGKTLWAEFDSDPAGATGSHFFIFSTIAPSPRDPTKYVAQLRQDPWFSLSGTGIETTDSVYVPSFWSNMATPPSWSDTALPAKFKGGVAFGFSNVYVGATSILGGTSSSTLPDSAFKGFFCPIDLKSRYVDGVDPVDIVDKLVERINMTIDSPTAPQSVLNTGVRAYSENGQLVIRERPGFGGKCTGKDISLALITRDQSGVVNETAYSDASTPNPIWRPLYGAGAPQIFRSNIDYTNNKISGGKEGLPAVSQITKVTIGGTMSVGAKGSITITDPDVADPYVFGASRVSGKSPGFSITYKSKQYAAVGSTMYFSSLNDARKWDIYDLGSGFIDMSNNFGGREDLTGFGVYQDKLAVFSRRNVQLWFLDADPAQNQQIQVLANTGCIAPDSVVSMGAIDLLYLADNGVRSLRARDGTDTAFASDIGSAIDSIVIAHLATLTEDQKAAARAVVEPVDGRYWLAVGDKIFVLSYFPGSQIAAWSTYETGFSVSEFAAQGDKVYARSGNTIYLYGGADGNTYDSCETIVELPYMNCKKPAHLKRAKAIDLTITGLWRAEMGFDHTAPNAREVVLRAEQATFAYGTIPVAGIGTHIGLRMVSASAGPAKISNVIVHYDDLQPKHEAG